MLQEYKIYGLKLKSDDQIYYIGRTSSKLSTRWSKHKTNAKLSKTNNFRSNWINKYKDEIEIILIEGNIKTRDESCEKEMFYISLYKEKYGFLINSTNGGDGGCDGYKHTEDAKIKIGNCHRGKPYVSEYMTNRIVSDETKAKMSENLKKYIIENGNPMSGKKRPDTTKLNIERTGWKHADNTKKQMSLNRTEEQNSNYKHGKKTKKYREEHKRIYSLTKNDVIKIRELYSTGNYNYKDIGNMFNITSSYASAVIRKIKWKNI